MKKAVIYARVSTEEQKKRGNIESQVAVLKRQVADHEDVLVKEYRDDGHSGAKLDRPGLNALRADAKTDLFDVVYFLAADRISRDAAYHTIIVGEILKENKQVIINGKDYKQNPENKFTLQVLGAMAELERAKIIERYSRGKMHKLRQGQLLNNGQKTYGYTYVLRSATESPKFLVHEPEAKIVRQIFKMYVEDGASKSSIMRYLEDQKIPTKTGLLHWQWKTLENILKNSSYMGIKYFNTRKMVRAPSDPLRKLKYGKEVFRDKSEWIAIKIPAIISKELFDKAQQRFEQNKQRYINPTEKQLLSNLVKCGVCGTSCTSYKRFVRGYDYVEGKLIRSGRVYHRVSYRCSRTIHQTLHSKNAPIKRCTNSEIFCHRLETCVLSMIQTVMTDPAKLKGHLSRLGEKKSDAKLATERQLAEMESRITKLMNAKREATDRYAKGVLNRNEYATLCKECDDDMLATKNERKKLLATVPALHQAHIVATSVEQYCSALKTRLEQSADFDSKRQLMLDYIRRTVFTRGKVEVHGAVPILLSAYADQDQTSEAKEIAFVVLGEIDPKVKGKDALSKSFSGTIGVSAATHAAEDDADATASAAV